MRGGTSKGLFFLSSDLPSNEQQRNRVLLAAMGSPDKRQIDGVGGAHPLTSKVAVVGPSSVTNADIDYLFIQVNVDEPTVSISQNCGNILAGVPAFAIEAGLIPATHPETTVTVHMVNTGGLAAITCQTPDGQINYEGGARIDGVPGTAAPVMLEFLDVAGSSCGSLFPTGVCTELVEGTPVTCIDNGMPVVLINSAAVGQSGRESPQQLEADPRLGELVQSIRLEAGKRMGLGDVSGKTVPKVCLVSAPGQGGVINTRTFIPHRVHEAIGVLGAVSVATACAIPETVASELAVLPKSTSQLDIEHPTGFFSVDVVVDKVGDVYQVKRAALLRTARMLMRGEVCVPSTAWYGHG